MVQTLAKILRGQEAVDSTLTPLYDELAQSGAFNKRAPRLVVIQVGDDPASTSYINQKNKLASRFKIDFTHCHISRTESKAAICEVIKNFSADPKVDAILLQLPLDSESCPGKTYKELLKLIPAHKDADGLDAINQGKVFCRESLPWKWNAPIPCTALGIYRMLEHYKIPLKGKRVTVIGRSRLVGLPTAGILTHAGATVTVCHRDTVDLAIHTRDADIVIAAAGVKHLVGPEHLKQGAVAIDVGIHRTAEGKLTGDVNPLAYAKLSAYSPVPGGVGPMTVGMLIENTLRLYSAHEKL